MQRFELEVKSISSVEVESVIEAEVKLNASINGEWDVSKRAKV